MKDGANLLAGGILLVAIFVAIAMNLVGFPLLLMVALGALGYEVSFWVALAFWLLTVFILNSIKSIFSR